MKQNEKCDQMPHVCFHTHITYSRTLAWLFCLKMRTPFKHLAPLCVLLPQRILGSGAQANPEGTAGPGVGSTRHFVRLPCWGRHVHLASDNLGSARLPLQPVCVLLKHRCTFCSPFMSLKDNFKAKVFHGFVNPNGVMCLDILKIVESCFASCHRAAVLHVATKHASRLPTTPHVVSWHDHGPRDSRDTSLRSIIS